MKQNIILIATGILVITGVGAWYGLREQYRYNQAQLAQQQANNNLELQTKCASQAQIFFEYFVIDPQERQNDEYSNHFSTKLNKCFVLIKQPTLPYATSGGNLYEKDLYDAVEKKQYGRYEWQSKSSVFSRDGFLAACAIFPDGDQINFKLCNSQNNDFDSSEIEFDNFVKDYMNN